MLSQSRKEKPMRLEPVVVPPAADTEARLLTDLALLEWLHAPSAIERLEAALGRKRLSQVLLLVALCPEEEDHLLCPGAAPRAA